MDPFSSFEPQFRAMFKDNAEAMDWAMLVRKHVHLIDDLEDKDLAGSRQFLKSHFTAIELYTHPFFVRHAAILAPLLRRITILYAVVVEWEQSETEWKRQWADHYRHCAVEIWITIADLAGGFDHAVDWAKECIATSYVQHHDPDGKPV